jgi:hypothetical protein
VAARKTNVRRKDPVRDINRPIASPDTDRAQHSALWWIFMFPGRTILWFQYMYPSRKTGVFGTARRRNVPLFHFVYSLGFYAFLLLLAVWLLISRR